MFNITVAQKTSHLFPILHTTSVLHQGKLLHFLTLRNFTHPSPAIVAGMKTGFLEVLRNNFASQSDHFTTPE